MQKVEMSWSDYEAAINAGQMTSELWQELAQKVKDEQEKEWQEFLERKNNYDDAFHRENWYLNGLLDLAANKGFVYKYALAKDGQVVPSVIVNGKYGEVWAIKESWDAYASVIEWVNVSKASTIEKEQAHYAKKGYQAVLVEVAGQVRKSEIVPDWSKIHSVEVCK